MQFISSVVLISASIRHERSQREKKIISEWFDAWQQPWLISSKVDTELRTDPFQDFCSGANEKNVKITQLFHFPQKRVIFARVILTKKRKKERNLYQTFMKIQR